MNLSFTEFLFTLKMRYLNTNSDLLQSGVLKSDTGSESFK